MEKEILTNDVKIAETFNNILKNVIDTSNIGKDESILLDTCNEADPVTIVIKKYKKYPSILRMKQ